MKYQESLEALLNCRRRREEALTRLPCVEDKVRVSLRRLLR